MSRPSWNCRLAALVLLALAAGCGGAHEHVRAGTEIRMVEAGPRLARRPLPPPLRAIALSIEGAPAGAGPLAADAVAAHLARALVESGAVDFVHVGASMARLAPEPPAVVVEVTPMRVALLESDGEGWTGAVVAYLFLGIWSDWFHDRRATLECALAVTLRDARTARVLGRVEAARGVASEDVSLWERRGGFWPVLATLFWVPPMAFDSSPERLVPVLAPRAFDGVAGAIVDALAAVPAREVRAIAFAPERVEGIDVSLIEVRAATGTARIDGRAAGATTPGAPRAAKGIGQGAQAAQAAPAPPETTVRLSGGRVPSVRRVWIGDELAFEAPPEDPATGIECRFEIGLKIRPASLASSGHAVIQVQVGDRPPVRLGELSTRTEWRLGDR